MKKKNPESRDFMAFRISNLAEKEGVESDFFAHAPKPLPSMTIISVAQSGRKIAGGIICEWNCFIFDLPYSYSIIYLKYITNDMYVMLQSR